MSENLATTVPRNKFQENQRISNPRISNQQIFHGIKNLHRFQIHGIQINFWPLGNCLFKDMSGNTFYYTYTHPHHIHSAVTGRVKFTEQLLGSNKVIIQHCLTLSSTLVLMNLEVSHNLDQTLERSLSCFAPKAPFLRVKLSIFSYMTFMTSSYSLNLLIFT
jgi:hypothetical protein